MPRWLHIELADHKMASDAELATRRGGSTAMFSGFIEVIEFNQWVEEKRRVLCAGCKTVLSAPDGSIENTLVPVPNTSEEFWYCPKCATPEQIAAQFEAYRSLVT